VSHLLALLLLAVDCLVRAWRIQLAVWASGGLLGLNEAKVRPVTSLVAIGVEVAAEWPVFGIVGAALLLYYVPDWQTEATHWLRRHRARELVAIEVVALLVLALIYMLQRMARSGMIRHRVRRQWRVAWAHVRRAPWWVLGAGAFLTAISIGARALILPALTWGWAVHPSFGQMFFGALTLLHAPLLLPLPSGGGGIEVAFLSGFAGDFGSHAVVTLLLWRFYTAVLLTVLGSYALIRSLGYRGATQLLKIGWVKRSREKAP
jgi:uncharacterized membrane protein YbhN (UPF0104 family)